MKGHEVHEQFHLVSLDEIDGGSTESAARQARAERCRMICGKIHEKVKLGRGFIAALDQSGGVRTRAADLLGISYRSFRHLMKKYEM